MRDLSTGFFLPKTIQMKKIYSFMLTACPFSLLSVLVWVSSYFCSLGRKEGNNAKGQMSRCWVENTYSHSISTTTIMDPKAMAAHSSALAWKIPWTEEPGRLQPMGSRRVGHDWASSLSFFTFMHWRRKWQPTPGSLPGESQGQGRLMGCRLWGRTESDTTEAT